jgi:hypothetical protein
MRTKLCLRILKGRDQSEDLRVDGRIMIHDWRGADTVLNKLQLQKALGWERQQVASLLTACTLISLLHERVVFKVTAATMR